MTKMIRIWNLDALDHDTVVELIIFLNEHEIAFELVEMEPL